MTKAAIREAGWDALVERLGLVGALRFFREYGLGSGDYTKKHQEWAARISDKELFALIEKARAERQMKHKKAGNSPIRSRRS
ncbi:MAG TPA: hypothetical protein VGQ99_22615 [Tepidisphaeraceae bacterium]|nr:hypothetical protein [Tepidisphaeraceae bacterium]